MEIDGKCGKHRKQRKTSKMPELDLVQTLQRKGAENVGKQWKTSETSELELVQTLQRKGVENVGKQQKTSERLELELVEIWYMTD